MPDTDTKPLLDRVVEVIGAVGMYERTIRGQGDTYLTDPRAGEHCDYEVAWGSIR